MRKHDVSPATVHAISAYFSKTHQSTQQETLGLIVSEILQEGCNLSRMAICTKLLRRVESATAQEEIDHFNGLIQLFFER